MSTFSGGESRPAARALVVLGLALGSLASCPQLTAAACGDGRPWVAISFEGEDFPPSIRADASADLAASLRLRDIDVCPSDGSGATKPLASVALHLVAGDRVEVSIDVRDAITNKRVQRDVDLHSVAPDARGLTLAQAADELLRASWVELTIADAPKPKLPPPAAVTKVVAESASRPPPAERPSRPVVGARFAFEHFGGGQNWLGADGFLDLWLARHLGASLGLGLRGGLSVDAADGRIATRAVLLSVDVFGTLWRAEQRYNLALAFGAQAVDVVVSGRAAEPARAEERNALGVNLHGGLLGFWRLTDTLRLSAQLAPGAAVRSVAARDNGRTITSTSGLALTANLGFGGEL